MIRGKSAWNVRERGLAFDHVRLLDWSKAIERQDARRDYGEIWFHALATRTGRHALRRRLHDTRLGDVASASAAPAMEKAEAMAKKPDPVMIDDENPEWTEADFAQAKPFKEMHPELYAAWKKRGRPPVETPKVHIGLRLAADVVNGIRATGKGYNARVEKVLREALAKGLL